MEKTAHETHELHKQEMLPVRFRGFRVFSGQSSLYSLYPRHSRHPWFCYLPIISTAVPLSLPARKRSSAVLACSKGNVSVFVCTGTRGAISKNSSPSRRVRFATEVITRSSQRSA